MNSSGLTEPPLLTASGIRLVYTDNHLLVVVKPPNLLSQADRSGDPDLLSILKAWMVHEYNKPGRAFIALVHRLDRPVGGLMVLARTSKAAARLSEQVRNRRVEKTYLAIVHGRPSPDRGWLHHFLLKDQDRNRTVVSVSNQPGSREARLYFQVLQTKDNLSLVRIKLETGRSHQIRAQMKAVNCPLYGDRKYGRDGIRASAPPGPVSGGDGSIALWSHRLRIAHPVGQRQLEFTDYPPNRQSPWSQFDFIRQPDAAKAPDNFENQLE